MVQSLTHQEGKGTEKHANSDGEGLSVYPVLAYWVSAVVKVQMKEDCAACNAFIAFADIADCMITVAHGTVSPDVLRKAAEDFWLLLLLHLAKYT